MFIRLILSGVFALSSLSFQASADAFRFSGLDKPYEKEWDGNSSELKFAVPFCVRLDSAPIPTGVTKTEIKYQLRFNDLNGGSGNHFVAVDNQKKLPVELSLNSSGLKKPLIPGKDSASLDNASLCKTAASTLSLSARVAGALDKIEAGTYRTRINARAFNHVFGDDADAILELVIKIPRLVGITAPPQITLDGFPSLQKTESICVYRNGSGFYNLKASSMNVEDGEFKLQRLGNLKASLPYKVNIQAAGINRNLNPGVLVRNLKGSISPTCQGGNKLQLKVSVPESTAKNAYEGTYQGQLKITVEAQ